MFENSGAVKQNVATKGMKKMVKHELAVWFGIVALETTGCWNRHHSKRRNRSLSIRVDQELKNTADDVGDNNKIAEQTAWFRLLY